MIVAGAMVFLYCSIIDWVFSMNEKEERFLYVMYYDIYKIKSRNTK